MLAFAHEIRGSHSHMKHRKLLIVKLLKFEAYKHTIGSLLYIPGVSKSISNNVLQAEKRHTMDL